MPIRFQCPECHARLKIGSHKVGVRKSCPYCSVKFTVPAGVEGELPVAQRWIEETSAASVVGSPPVPESAPTQESSQDGTPRRHHQNSGEMDSQTAVSSSSTSNLEAPPLPQATPQSLTSEVTDNVSAEHLSIPRRMVYVYGGLIAVVALFFFLFGLMTGKNLDRTRARVTAPKVEKCVVTGTVMFKRDNQRFPDVGSLVILVPTQSTPDVRPQGESLHPSQKAAVDSPDAQLIRTFGGEVARVDGSGQFRVTLAGGQKYDLLIISANLQSNQGIDRELRAMWGRVFVPIEPVIGDQACYASQVQTGQEVVELDPVVLN